MIHVGVLPDSLRSLNFIGPLEEEDLIPGKKRARDPFFLAHKKGPLIEEGRGTRQSFFSLSLAALGIMAPEEKKLRSTKFFLLLLKKLRAESCKLAQCEGKKVVSVELFKSLKIGVLKRARNYGLFFLFSL